MGEDLPMHRTQSLRPFRRSLSILGVTVAVVVSVAACGGSDDTAETSGQATTGPSPTTSLDSTPAATDASATTTAAPTTTIAATTTTIAPMMLFDERGPYDVGVATIELGDRQTEVYYPALPDAEAETEIFDTLSVFPENLQDFIPEELSGLTETNAYRDAAPITDAPEGGLPIVVYSHGFGGFRQVATFHTTHLASWGYVVLSTDHLERGISAQASGELGGGVENQDVLDVLNSIEALAADERFASLADVDRVAITGHSAGAGTSYRAAAEDIIDGFVSISGGARDGVTQKPALVIIGELDAVVPADASYALYEQLEANAVLVNIANSGHNAFTDSCRGIRDLGGLDALAELIGEDQVERAEDGCVEPFVEPEAAQAALNHYSVLFLEALFSDNPLGADGDALQSSLTVDDLDAGDSDPVEVVYADFQAR